MKDLNPVPGCPAVEEPEEGMCFVRDGRVAIAKGIISPLIVKSRCKGCMVPVHALPIKETT